MIFLKFSSGLMIFFCLFVFSRQVFSVYSPGCPGTHSVDQAGLEHRNPPASASQVLGLQACAITARLGSPFKSQFPSPSSSYLSSPLHRHCLTLRTFSLTTLKKKKKPLSYFSDVCLYSKCPSNSLLL